MNCLKDYIQISDLAAPGYSYSVEGVAQPASGLFINTDLPISLNKLDHIVNNGEMDFWELWSKVQDRAIRKFILRVKAGYKELFSCLPDDVWICTNRDYLKHALLYFLGGELMFELVYSDRINRFTVGIDRKKAQDLRTEFEDQFVISLKDGLEVASPSKVENGDVFTYVEVLP